MMASRHRRVGGQAVSESRPAQEEPEAPSDRSVRVFVSSTFRDMVPERNELATHAWPALQAVCDDLGITFSDVDLRWGITEEQSARGEVIPRCLAEIDACRPYFVGILGERYGWVPTNIPGPTLDGLPWLDATEPRSATELEIIHGALAEQARQTRAFIYFRDPAYADSLPEAKRADYLPEDDAARERSTALKERIRRTPGLHLREGFKSPQELVSWVVEDLERDIRAAFPPADTSDMTARSRRAHAAFSAARRVTYVPNDQTMGALDREVVLRHGSVVVTGESGLGKSALLANWAARLKAAVPEVRLVEHYCGADTESTHWTNVCRRVVAELAAQAGTSVPLSDDPVALRTQFASALRQLSGDERCVIVIDGLNQLEDKEGALDLAWLPTDLGDRVLFVVSALPGRALDETLRRGWTRLELAPLSAEERRQLTTRYLAGFAKALPDELISRIAGSQAAANPLFLRTLLDELRVVAAYKSVKDLALNYLAAGTVERLLDLVLARWERDYESDRPRLVADVMRVLWSARDGVTERDLLAALGDRGAPVPRAIVTPLLLALRPMLISHSGRLRFSHGFIRHAAEMRYLPTKADQRSAFAHAARVQADRGAARPDASDYAWYLWAAKDWNGLRACLDDPAWFRRIHETEPDAIPGYLSDLLAAHGWNTTRVFRATLRRRMRDVAELLPIASFVQRRESVDTRLRMWRRLMLPHQPAEVRTYALAEYAAGVIEAITRGEGQTSIFGPELLPGLLSSVGYARASRKDVSSEHPARMLQAGLSGDAGLMLAEPWLAHNATRIAVLLRWIIARLDKSLQDVGAQMNPIVIAACLRPLDTVRAHAPTTKRDGGPFFDLAKTAVALLRAQDALPVALDFATPETVRRIMAEKIEHIRIGESLVRCTADRLIGDWNEWAEQNSDRLPARTRIDLIRQAARTHTQDTELASRVRLAALSGEAPPDDASRSGAVRAELLKLHRELVAIAAATGSVLAQNYADLVALDASDCGAPSPHRLFAAAETLARSGEGAVAVRLCLRAAEGTEDGQLIIDAYELASRCARIAGDAADAADLLARSLGPAPAVVGPDESEARLSRYLRDPRVTTHPEARETLILVVFAWRDIWPDLFGRPLSVPNPPDWLPTDRDRYVDESSKDEAAQSTLAGAILDVANYPSALASKPERHTADSRVARFLLESRMPFRKTHIRLLKARIAVSRKGVLALTVGPRGDSSQWTSASRTLFDLLTSLPGRTFSYSEIAALSDRPLLPGKEQRVADLHIRDIDTYVKSVVYAINHVVPYDAQRALPPVFENTRHGYRLSRATMSLRRLASVCGCKTEALRQIARHNRIRVRRARVRAHEAWALVALATRGE